MLQRTERIRKAKILSVVAAILIAAESMVVKGSLTHDLAKQARSHMEVKAEDMRPLSEAEEYTDLR